MLNRPTRARFLPLLMATLLLAVPEVSAWKTETHQDLSRAAVNAVDADWGTDLFNLQVPLGKHESPKVTVDVHSCFDDPKLTIRGQTAGDLLVRNVGYPDTDLDKFIGKGTWDRFWQWPPCVVNPNTSQQWRHSYFVLPYTGDVPIYTGWGGAPDEVDHYTEHALNAFSNGKSDRTGFFYMSLASHYVEDMGVPYHVGHGVLQSGIGYGLNQLSDIEAPHDIFEEQAKNGVYYSSSAVNVDGRDIPVHDAPSDYAKKLAARSREKGYALDSAYLLMASPEPISRAFGVGRMQQTTRALEEDTALYTAGYIEHVIRLLPRLQATIPTLSGEMLDTVVTNTGQSHASHTTVRVVRFASGGSWTAAPVATVVGEQEISVPAGQSVAVRIQVPPPAPGMSYAIVLDPTPYDGAHCSMGGRYGCILDNAEARGVVAPAPVVVPVPRPDLSIAASDLHLQAGQVTADVRNLGPGNAGPFEVRLYSRPPPSGAPTLVSSQWIANGLGAGAFASVQLPYAGTLFDGFVRVDEADHATEVDDSGNNQASLSGWTISESAAYSGAMLQPTGDVTVASGASLTLSAGSSLRLAPGAHLLVEPGAVLELHSSTLAAAAAGQNFTATVRGTLVLDHATISGAAGGIRFSGMAATVMNSTLTSLAGAPALAIESGVAALADNVFRDGEGSGLLLSRDAAVTSVRDAFEGNRGTAIDARGGTLELHGTTVNGSAVALSLSGGAYVSATDAVLAPSAGPRAPASTVGVQSDGGVLEAQGTTVTGTTSVRGSLGSLDFRDGGLDGAINASGGLLVAAHDAALEGPRSVTDQARFVSDHLVSIEAISPTPDSFAIPYASLKAHDAAGALAFNGTTDGAGEAALMLPEFTQTAAGTTVQTPYIVQAQHNGAPTSAPLDVAATQSLVLRPQVLPDLSVLDVAPTYEDGQLLLWARVKDGEPASAMNVTVEFLVDGAPIGQVTLPWIPAQGRLDASVPLPALQGIHTFTARIDPNGAIAETHEDNNALVRQAWVIAGNEGCDTPRTLDGTLLVLPGARLSLACGLNLGGDPGRATTLDVKGTLNLTAAGYLAATPDTPPYVINVAGDLEADGASITGTGGIVATNGRLQLRHASLSGSGDRLLDVRQASVEVSGSTFTADPSKALSTGLRVDGGTILLRGNSFTGLGAEAVRLENLREGTIQGNNVAASGVGFLVANSTVTIEDGALAEVGRSVVALLAHPTLVNVTHDLENTWLDQGSSIAVGWHGRAAIVGSDGEKGSGVVTVIDRFGQWRTQAATAADGWTPDLRLIERILTETDGDGAYDQQQAYTPYTLQAGDRQVTYAAVANGDVAIPQTYAPALTASPSYLEGAAGATFQFPVQARDGGNGADTMAFTLSGATPGWTASIAPASATVPQGGSAAVTVTLRAPAQQDATGFVNVTATAEDGTTALVRLAAKTGVNAPPIALFNAAPAVAYRGDPMAFLDGSRDMDGWIANWTWDFGDGATSHAGSPEHAFATLGLKTVRLTVVDNGGASAMATGVVEVVNRRPTLRDSEVTPQVLASSGTATFRVTYRDLDGDAPDFVSIVVDGQEHVMAPVGPATPFIEGRVYQAQVTGLGRGIHRHHFEASDGLHVAVLPNGFEASGPTVNDAPTLASATISPSSGTPGTLFTYRVVYRDPDGDPPAMVEAVVDGASVAMGREQAGSQTYAAGVAYVAHSTLAPGAHTVRFQASDGQGTAALDAVAPSVLGSSPLRDATVMPATGAPGTSFAFQATWQANGSAPSAVTLVLDGQSHAMAADPAPLPGGGTVYRASIPVTAVGQHAYRVVAVRDSSTFQFPEAGGFDGPFVNTPPAARLAAIPAGSVADYFVANGGASTDAETPPGSLETRVTWGDGDRTPWARQLTHQHLYASPGAYSVVLEVRDLGGAVTSTTLTVTVQDQAPTASLVVTPTVGNVAEGSVPGTVFTFQPGASGDLEDPWDSLAVRWDWEGDGAWDTAWGSIDPVAHTYPAAGTYVAVVAVRDSSGQEDTAASQVVVETTRSLPLGATAGGTLVTAGHRQVWKVVVPPTPTGQVPPHNLEATLTLSGGGANLDLYGQMGKVPDLASCSSPCRAGTSLATEGTERICWGLPGPGTYYLVAVAKSMGSGPATYQLSAKAAVLDARVDLLRCTAMA